ncbi:hypothetical protein BG011_004574 [Mortierella polycephala]|uniref:Ion transport domain-containing protein n=1 Tax=Mortierella polycephala TaxID=41804 RepID=A0A9P6U2I0_9FUNG|nr:hypothetical protein BG011_004574 [Mortierella polycephala]
MTDPMEKNVYIADQENEENLHWRKSASTAKVSVDEEQDEVPSRISQLNQERARYHTVDFSRQITKNKNRESFSKRWQLLCKGPQREIEEYLRKLDARIPKREVREGYYSVIWCMSPQHLGRLLLKELTFEVVAPLIKYKLWAKLSKDQIESLDVSGMVRLRLQQKLHLRFDSQVFLRIFGELHSALDQDEALNGQDNHFAVHYVELEPLGPDTSKDDRDVIVKAPGKMLQQLDARACELPHCPRGYLPTAQIFAVDVSASGAYSVVLSATRMNAYVGIWDLESTLRSTPTMLHEPAPLSITSQPPMASIALPLQEGDFNCMRLVRVAISSDGSSAAIYQQPHEEDMAPGDATPGTFKFPFRLFHVRSDFTDVENLQETSSSTSTLVEDVSITKIMDHFVGYGKFLRKDLLLGRHGYANNEETASEDYFVACTESRINLYDASRKWKRLYGIAIGSLSSTTYRVAQLRALFCSIEGSTFVWWEDQQNVSVWDLVTGANVKYISINNHSNRVQNEIEHLTVSKGGRLLALAGPDWIKTFFMDSGIEVCEAVIREGDGSRILDIQFLDEDKSLLVTTGKSTVEQHSVIMDARNLSFHHCASRRFPTSTYSIQMVTRLSSGATAEQQDLEHVMMKVNGNEMEMFAIPHPRSTLEGGLLVNCKDDCAMRDSLTMDHNVHRIPGSRATYHLAVDFEERNQDNQQLKLVQVTLLYVDEHGSVLQLMSIIPEPWNTLDVEEEEPTHHVQASFLPSWSQFIIVFSMGFQVWNLPNPSLDNRCELALAWVHPQVESNHEPYCYAAHLLEAKVCLHGESVQPVWYDHKRSDNTTTCVRIPKSNWLTPIETLYCINSLPALIACYSDASASCQDAIIRHIMRHINQDPPIGTTKDSVMSKIAWASRWKGCSDVLSAIFRSNDGKWIPRCSATDDINRVTGNSSVDNLRSTRVNPTNPIMFLLKNAKKEPWSMPMAEQLIDYCIHEAKLQREPAFLSPVLDCLPHMVVFHPETAIDVMRRSAFIPVKDRAFTVNNSLVAHPPRFWIAMAIGFKLCFTNKVLRRQRTPIYEAPNSVFQLKSQLPKICARKFSKHIDVATETAVDPLNETFKRHVFVAPFALLWHVRERSAELVSMKMEQVLSMREQTSLLRMLSGLVMDKLNPWSRQTIRANFTELEFFDNPAVEALLEYKWNSFACLPWTIRFVGQLVYYVLVMTVTLLQVYPKTMMVSSLEVPLMAIIVMGGMFFYLELQQFLADHWKYMRSPYNLMDLGVFLMPVIGSVQLLVDIPKNANTTVLGNSRVMSFSIIIIYIHLLFEMRVLRSVCNIVTIILSIVVKIRVFFAIFAVSVLAFSHSFLHLIWAQNHDCHPLLNEHLTGAEVDTGGVLGDRGCAFRVTDFPSHFAGAVSATYFFMAGRYEPVEKNLDSDDWAFHIMLATYFFMSVILMLNVLIALMNVAFSVGDNDGPLVWLDNRLRSVESAENLSYSAPGLRERFDWFPQYIYYTASPRQIQAFEAKYPNLQGHNYEGYPSRTLVTTSNFSAPVVAPIKQLESLEALDHVSVTDAVHPQYRIQQPSLTVQGKDRQQLSTVSYGASRTPGSSVISLTSGQGSIAEAQPSITKSIGRSQESLSGFQHASTDATLISSSLSTFARSPLQSRSYSQPLLNAPPSRRRVSVETSAGESRSGGAIGDGGMYFPGAQSLTDSSSQAEGMRAGPRTRARYLPPPRQGTGFTISNFLRGKNDLDGDGIDDKFERDDDLFDYNNQDLHRGIDGGHSRAGAKVVTGAGNGVGADGRANQEERQFQMQVELRTVQETTEQLRENVKGLESKIDQMAAMIGLLLQQQQP